MPIIKCIRDNNKPKEIKQSKWVELEKEYELIFITYCLPAKELGFTLAEIEFTDEELPYEVFKGDRFAIKQSDLEAFFKMCADTRELDNLDLNQLLKESELEVLQNV
jgi:hypothetical protein